MNPKRNRNKSRTRKRGKRSVAQRLRRKKQREIDGTKHETIIYTSVRKAERAAQEALQISGYPDETETEEMILPDVNPYLIDQFNADGLTVIQNAITVPEVKLEVLEPDILKRKQPNQKAKQNHPLRKSHDAPLRRSTRAPKPKYPKESKGEDFPTLINYPVSSTSSNEVFPAVKIKDEFEVDESCESREAVISSLFFKDCASCSLSKSPEQETPEQRELRLKEKREIEATRRASLSPESYQQNLHSQRERIAYRRAAVKQAPSSVPQSLASTFLRNPTTQWHTNSCTSAVTTETMTTFASTSATTNCISTSALSNICLSSTLANSSIIPPFIIGSSATNTESALPLPETNVNYVLNLPTSQSDSIRSSNSSLTTGNDLSSINVNLILPTATNDSMFLPSANNNPVFLPGVNNNSVFIPTVDNSLPTNYVILPNVNPVLNLPQAGIQGAPENAVLNSTQMNVEMSLPSENVNFSPSLNINISLPVNSTGLKSGDDSEWRISSYMSLSEPDGNTAPISRISSLDENPTSNSSDIAVSVSTLKSSSVTDVATLSNINNFVLPNIITDTVATSKQSRNVDDLKNSDSQKSSVLHSDISERNLVPTTTSLSQPPYNNLAVPFLSQQPCNDSIVTLPSQPCNNPSVSSFSVKKEIESTQNLHPCEMDSPIDNLPFCQPTNCVTKTPCYTPKNSNMVRTMPRPNYSKFMNRSVLPANVNTTMTRPVFNPNCSTTMTRPVFNPNSSKTATRPVFNTNYSATMTRPRYTYSKTMTRPRYTYSKTMTRPVLNPNCSTTVTRSVFDPNANTMARILQKPYDGTSMTRSSVEPSCDSSKSSAILDVNNSNTQVTNDNLNTQVTNATSIVNEGQSAKIFEEVADKLSKVLPDTSFVKYLRDPDFYFFIGLMPLIQMLTLQQKIHAHMLIKKILCDLVYSPTPTNLTSSI